ncbi:DUF4154 domain-containing protein [Bowmanella sp. Y26]|uniref:YfiR family protein n=1 Tax=Bowmanella yangjiangensis TaxID=2811230 RepID=UPI001BDD6269|nr:YfiR family protein [Bowmanella yangjiangensis]MBT1065995.1 DUF4154 domain-containing protein [Bowmanella yangjiangensis]
MRKGSSLIIAVLMVMSLLSTGQVWSQGFSSEQLRAPFLLHIANFTQFIDEGSQQPVNFCFLEGNNFAHAKVFKGSPNQQVKQRAIKLIELQDAEQLSQQSCQILFVSQDKEDDKLFSLLAEINRHTVSIGESLNFIRNGGMMAIVPLQSKMKIFFNQEVYQQTDLKFSSALLKRVNFR